jgi:uncharacterized membrane protein (TIGR02234 family)
MTRSPLSGPAAAVVPTLLGAALTLLSTSRAWVRASLDDPVVGHVAVSASGRQAAPVVPAVALVALAGGVALLLARTLGRRVAGVLLVLAGAAGTAATVSLQRVPTTGVADLVTRAVGVTGAAPASVTVSAWPWLALAGCALVALGGAVAVLRAGRWSGPRSRYEAPGPSDATEPVEQADVGATWDALSRGEDPTGRPAPDLPQ